MDIKLYRIIYEAVEDVRTALEGLLKPEEREVVLGEAEVLQLFKVSKVGTIAGCSVRSGIIQRTAKARVMRDGVEVYTGALSSLKRFKDDVREVREGLRVRHRHRELQRHQGRRPDRVVPHGGGQADPPAGGRRRGGVIVGIQVWELHLPGCHSLKEKRGTLKPLTAALRQKLNVSVAETGHQDLWQRAEIACAAVGSARPVVEETLRAADRAIEEADGVRIVDTVTVWR